MYKILEDGLFLMQKLKFVETIMHEVRFSLLLLSFFFDSFTIVKN